MFFWYKDPSPVVGTNQKSSTARTRNGISSARGVKRSCWLKRTQSPTIPGLFSNACTYYRREGDKMNPYDNSTPFDTTIWSMDPQIDFAVAHLEQEMKRAGSVKRWHQRHADHIKIVLINLLDVYQRDKESYVSYSRNKNNYGGTSGGRAWNTPLMQISIMADKELYRENRPI